MRDRLIWLIKNAEKAFPKDSPVLDIEEFVADFLLANGVIVPPCKVGDSCYPFPRYKTPIVERKISRITFSKRNIIIGYYENDGQYRPPLRTRVLGEDVFLTREAAEQALKGGERGMKLSSILRAMDDEDEISVADENAPIDKAVLFSGSVKACKKQGCFRNGIVTSLCAYNDTLLVAVDIEYQKRKAVRSDG